MKRLFFRLSVLLSAVIIFASCLGNNDDDYIYYGDMSIQSFTLGTLNCYLTSKASDGTDSTYKETVKGSDYKFFIDQINHEIYNPDSLPFGTDAKHVICTITSKNSGGIGIKSLISDTVFVYNSTDSIDFSSPRHVMIYAMDGSGVRDYTVRVNVHQEKEGELRWTAKNVFEAFQPMTDMKAVVCGERLYVAGTDGTTESIYSTALTDGDTWTAATPDIALPAGFWQNVITDGQYIYALNGSNLVRSTDGNHWDEVGAADVQRLAGAADGMLYGLTADGIMCSPDGTSWTASAIDDSQALLPVRDLSLCTEPLKTDPGISRLLLTGNRSEADYPNDQYSASWVRITTDETSPWMFCTAEPSNHKLPRQNHLAVIKYCDGFLALGAEGIGYGWRPFTQFYYTLDCGLNWITDSRFVLPEGFSCNSAFAMTVDADHFIWIVTSGSGQVWRGRLNDLGWDTIQREFK
ncbi:MAG: hypothetical protein IKX36_02065 [Prevotella sp.]|nr:hypothetical protein [Prevotella sp.]